MIWTWYWCIQHCWYGVCHCGLGVRGGATGCPSLSDQSVRRACCYAFIVPVWLHKCVVSAYNNMVSELSWRVSMPGLTQQLVRHREGQTSWAQSCHRAGHCSSSALVSLYLKVRHLITNPPEMSFYYLCEFLFIFPMYLPTMNHFLLEYILIICGTWLLRAIYQIMLIDWLIGWKLLPIHTGAAIVPSAIKNLKRQKRE